MQLVTDRTQTRTDERSLQDLHSDLVNFKMVVEVAEALQLLNSASTIDGIFYWLPKQFQERFTQLAFKKGYDMKIVPFHLFLEFIERSQRLASSRLKRLMAVNKAKTLPNVGTHSKIKSARATLRKLTSTLNLHSLPSGANPRRHQESSIAWPVTLLVMLFDDERTSSSGL